MSVYWFISAEKARTPVCVCCELLGVSRSGYYDWLRRLRRENQRLMQERDLLKRAAAFFASVPR